MNRTRVQDLGPVFGIVARILLFFVGFYFFICSLNFLSSASLLLLGRDGGEFISESGIFSSKPVGLMVGVFLTVIFQSSSTTTSIIVSLVGSGVIHVDEAIPIVMGANIGTSVTNTLVSMGQIGDRNNFERAFAAATVHDMFNWLTVLVLLPLEMASGYLEKMTAAIVESFEISKGEEIVLLEAMTKPFTNLIIQIDKDVFAGWAGNDSKYDNVTSLLKDNCERKVFIDGNWTVDKYQCGYLFADCGIEEIWIGVCMLIIALVALVGSLGVIVKVLNSMMKDKVVDLIKTKMNGDLPYVPWLTNYVAMTLGAIITFGIQSSSVFTSTLTPLVGTGVFTIERAYALTLGSNIGTCGTSMIAALAGSLDLTNSLQIALCHLFFNISGTLLFYPVPFMRWPIPAAQALGATVAKYRWFVLLYLISMFILLPGYVMGLSFIDQENSLGVYIGFLPLVAIFVIILIINAMQKKCPDYLPKLLRNWDFLPLWMHSLKPMDRIISRVQCCNRWSTDAALKNDKDDISISVVVVDETASIESDGMRKKLESMNR